MLKKISIAMLLMTVLMVATPIAKADEQTSTTDTEITITPRKNIVDWRFKTIDGNLYKRLYDYTAQKWIGSWQRV
ncbi:MAG: hypothetical protein LKF43_10095 [Streptococcaceae bacterium]|jgi:hypothetical protein|nr:hypothetical protein [Streptococcaceae bacterium]